MPVQAQAWSTGPALIYAGVGPSYYPLFLGTCQRPPRIRLNPKWVEVENDLTGQIPYDKAFGGEDANVQAVFTRFNQQTLLAMQARPRHNFALPAGKSAFGEIGALMKTEGLAYPIWVVFPYFSKAAYNAGQGGIPGYKFYQSWLEGPDDLSDLGTVARTVGLIWYASYALAYSGAAGLTYGLYSTDPADFAGLPAAV